MASAASSVLSHFLPNVNAATVNTSNESPNGSEIFHNAEPTPQRLNGDTEDDTLENFQSPGGPTQYHHNSTVQSGTLDQANLLHSSNQSGLACRRKSVSWLSGNLGPSKLSTSASDSDSTSSSLRDTIQGLYGEPGQSNSTNILPSSSYNIFPTSKSSPRDTYHAGGMNMDGDNDMNSSMRSIHMDHSAQSKPTWQEEEDNVPESLLRNPRHHENHRMSQNNPTFYPPRSGTPSGTGIPMAMPPINTAPAPNFIADAYERAVWKWVNVDNLDRFLVQVYQYYLGRGIWSIILRRSLSLLTIAFIVAFSTYMTQCIDYAALPHAKSLREVQIPHCTRKMPLVLLAFLWIFSFVWIYTASQYLVDVQRLWSMRDFYHYLLNIRGHDIECVSWNLVVERLTLLRNYNALTTENLSAISRDYLKRRKNLRLSYTDIAHRLMRRDNYLIAMIRENILDLTLRLPFIGKKVIFTRSVEWNIRLCILNFAMNEENGQISRIFLDADKRVELTEILRRRFILTGILNLILVPFLLGYYYISYFLQYFTEYHHNPSALDMRTFTPLARWKFRKYNELSHTFVHRVDTVITPLAVKYLAEYPKDIWNQLLKFIQFISGSITSILILISIFDPELFLNFEITPNKTSLFYIGIFTAIYTACRNSITDKSSMLDYDKSFIPEYHLHQICHALDYWPTKWRNQPNSAKARREFCRLFKLKIFIFFEETLSIIFTPFILIYLLPRSTFAIIDFFRQSTVYIDGLGFVCSYALQADSPSPPSLIQNHLPVSDIVHSPLPSTLPQSTSSSSPNLHPPPPTALV